MQSDLNDEEKNYQIKSSRIKNAAKKSIVKVANFSTK